MWRENLKNLSSNLTFHPPASNEEIYRIALELHNELPEALRDILLESNGVDGEYGLGLLWNTQRIIEENLTFRTNLNFPEIYMPFDNLLFFGDAGNGDQFAFRILRRGTEPDVFVWNHEDDSRSWIAPSLSVFYDWWMTGRITI